MASEMVERVAHVIEDTINLPPHYRRKLAVAIIEALRKPTPQLIGAMLRSKDGQLTVEKEWSVFIDTMLDD